MVWQGSNKEYKYLLLVIGVPVVLVLVLDGKVFARVQNHLIEGSRKRNQWIVSRCVDQGNRDSCYFEGRVPIVDQFTEGRNFARGKLPELSAETREEKLRSTGGLALRENIILREYSYRTKYYRAEKLVPREKPLLRAETCTAREKLLYGQRLAP